MDLHIHGKNAIVTGGSRGIGKAITYQLAKEGVNCTICGRDEEKLKSTANEISGNTEVNIYPLLTDLNDKISIQSFIQRAYEKMGSIDILVNNGARVSGDLPEDFFSISDELILKDFNEKFLGYLRCCRMVEPYMREKGWGRIINISGNAARVAGNISAGARNVSVVHLTKTLSKELGKYGINVNAIYPATTLTEKTLKRIEEISKRKGVSGTDLFVQSANNAIGRLVKAEEIAYVVTFLASPMSVGVTGEVIAVTGGMGEAVYY